MLEKIKKIKLSNKNQITIILFSITVMMLLLNILTPLLADDFSYSFGNNGKIKNLVDVYDYQIWHYFYWGGRSVAHTFAQIFLLFPKWVFSILNSFIYTGTVYLIYLHVKGKSEDKPAVIIMIHFLLWFLLPVFGQTFLWLIGSCNYLWTTFIVLLFLLPYRNNLEKNDNLKLIITMFLFGILSGWTNENTAVGLLVIETALVLIKKQANKKEKLKKWHVSGILGSLIGFTLMIVAPGNFVRKETLTDNTFFLFKLIKRTIEYSYTAVDYLIPLIIICVIAISIKIYKNKKVDNKAYVYIAGAFFSIYSMVLSPQFPERAWTGVFIFAIIGTLVLVYDIDKIKNIFKIVMIDIIILLGIVYTKEYMQAAVDINKLRTTWKMREEYIEKEKSKNKKNIELEQYFPGNSKNPDYGLSDINPDKEHWANKAIARYYGIKTIKSIEKSEE